MARISKSEVLRRQRISAALKLFHKNKILKEKQRREKISKALKAYHVHKRKLLKKSKKVSSTKKPRKKRLSKKSRVVPKVSKRPRITKRLPKKRKTTKTRLPRKVSAKRKQILPARKKKVVKSVRRLPKKERLRRLKISKGLKYYHAKKKKRKRSYVKKPKNQRQAHVAIIESLQHVRNMCPDLDIPAPRVHDNSDGTIDGELRVGVSRFDEIRNALRDVKNNLIKVPGTWITVGLRFDPTVEGDLDEETINRYKKYRGLLSANTHYSHTEDLELNFLVADVEIAKNFESNNWQAPKYIFVGMHWGKKQPFRY